MYGDDFSDKFGMSTHELEETLSRSNKSSHNHTTFRGYDPEDYPDCPTCEIQVYRSLS